MPPKESSEPIRARFLLNAPEDWTPEGGDTETQAGQGPMDKEEYTITIGVPPFREGGAEEPIRLTMTDRELRDQFAEYIQTTIDPVQNQTDHASGRRLAGAHWLLVRVALLAIARDPSGAQIPTLSLRQQREGEPIASLEEHFERVVMSRYGALFKVTSSWDRREQELGHDTPDTIETSRAQSLVPKWYGKECILSGFPTPQGSHIVPLRALEKNAASSLWNTLRMLWPLPHLSRHDLDALALGGEEANILPLSPNARVLWHKNKFAFRPIAHPTDPQHRMFLQVIWLQGSDNVLTDFRRNRNRAGPFPGIRHGDVYELVTSDPVAHPLPSFHYLQIQLGVHKILAGVQAVVVDGVLFAGDPPDDIDLGLARGEKDDEDEEEEAEADEASPESAKSAKSARTPQSPSRSKSKKMIAAVVTSLRRLWPSTLVKHIRGLFSTEKNTGDAK